MATALASQLSQIAANSTNQLDLKAQKAAHSQSLIFERKFAGSQDFDTIYQICLEGFQELCLLDARFTAFGRSIFSEQSKSEDRTQMTAAQNEELDAVLDAFLWLIGGRLLLKPAVKAVDWLIRRFRVHEYNASTLLLTFLPYHTTPLFLNLLSILPSNLPVTFKFLHPYIRNLTNPPRQAIVYSASHNTHLFSSLNTYALQVSRAQSHYHGLLSFWVGVVSEAVVSMLDSARSGRRDVQTQREEDELLKILPVLNEGFSINNVPDLVLGCYTLAIIVANKANLKDQVLDSMMEAISRAWSPETIKAGVICLSSVAQHKQQPRIPEKVVTRFLRLQNPTSVLSELCLRYHTGSLALGLILGCLRSIGKRKHLARLDFIEGVLQAGILEPSQVSKAVAAIFSTAQSLDADYQDSPEVRLRIINMIHKLNESSITSPLVQQAINASKIDLMSLGVDAQLLVTTAADPGPIKYVSIEDVGTNVSDDRFAKAIIHIPERTVDEVSFLSHSRSHVYDILAEAFLLAANSTTHMKTFIALPILRREAALEDPFYVTFFLRIACGPHAVYARAAALKVLTTFISETTGSSVDFQALIPYAIAALMDTAAGVRKEASDLIVALSESYKKISMDHKEGGDPAKYGCETFYGPGQESKSVFWLSVQDVDKITRRVLLPAIEESIMDSSQISNIMESALKGSSLPHHAGLKTVEIELKKSLRHSLFSFLTTHVVHTPLYAVKLRHLTFLNRVEKVGSTSRTKELLPVLQNWADLSNDETMNVSEAEHIDLSDLENQVAAIVSPIDKDGVNMVLSNASNKNNPSRPSWTKALLDRIRVIWPSLNPERQLSVAEHLLEISMGLTKDDNDYARDCRDLLRSLELPTAALLRLVDTIQSSITDVRDHASAPKRRRTSQNEMVALSVKDPKEMSALIQRMTFTLELVDSSKPENHPQLLGGLFHALGALHQFKAQIQSELTFLLSLVLGSLLAIVNKLKTSSTLKLDSSAVRADIIVDCVRITESPQVQNAALLLVASLASAAPELVLHSVMPIFTFMGSSILRKNDEYAAHVIDQTIDQVIPPLIQSLRKQKRDVVSGTSELLLSFTAAFEHIPFHRRLRLFEALIAKLGPEDFLFAVLAMLVNRYPADLGIRDFATSLAGTFGPELQLITYLKYLDLAKDCVDPKPTQAHVLLGIGGEDGRDPQTVTLELLQLLSHLLRKAPLSAGLNKVLRVDNNEAFRIRIHLSEFIEQTLSLTASVRSVKPLSQVCGNVLGSFLGTLSLFEFIKTIENLLQRPDDELRRKVLKLLESRLRSVAAKDPNTQSAVLDFVPVLNRIIEDSSDVLLKHTAVACVDRISESYGKKDLPRMAEAAKIIASEQCMGGTDDRIRIMGALCLASMVEVIGEAIIPILPEAFPRAFDLLRISLREDEESPRLHDAVLSLISALLVHVPFMIGDTQLDTTLRLSFESANSDLGDESDESRRAALDLIAKRVDARECFAAIERHWSIAVSEGPEAVKEALYLLNTAIEKHPKSSVVKNAAVLSNLFFKAFDLRRVQFSERTEDSYEEDEVHEIEDVVNDVAITMIYKMNDATFRPLFVRLVGWATNGLPRKDAIGKTLRLTTFYNFLRIFFDTLKSIVTSYARYVIDSVVETLNNFQPQDSDSKTLWSVAIAMLSKAFEHDQDEFWQSPSHFTAISAPLLNQISYVSTTLSVVSEVIPAITALAATADSPEHHKEMNTTIMKHLRSDDTQVRLAAVKCEQSLTERLGEDWLSLLPEMLPGISELLEGDSEEVEREARRWVLQIEEILGQSLDSMLQ